ncbi:MAG TPA: efflux RND transporter permease subunit, partial [Rhizobiales bacterium]|nr:efflux RND transporter permease subunit [Hyphomicrobiales bacterium]
MERLLSYPHAMIAFYILLVIAGVLGFQSLPLKLFPDTNRPMVSVIVQWPGAAASDVARDVTHPIEVRMSAIDGVRKVTSTSRDEVSAVKVEFEYGIDIEDAAMRVNTELPRVAGSLPEGIKTPLILKITDAARPVMVLAVRAADGYDLNLG